MHYPRPPHRPQAYRVRFVGRRRSTRMHGVSTWYFCVAALALVATVVGLDTSRRAVAAPDHSEPEARAVDGIRAHAWDHLGFPMLLQPAVAHAAPEEAPDGGPATPTHAADTPTAPAGTPRHAPPVAAPVQAAATAAPARQSRQLYAQLTAYSASVEEGTAWGITRSGTRVRPGVVAVDPAVIPLGSRVRIAGLPGTYVAEDTGGGIRGAHVDVYMESRAAALQFGYRKSVLIEVLE